jgi:hypothetical protein
VFLSKIKESSCPFNAESGKPNQIGLLTVEGFRNCCMNVAGSEDKETG